MSPSPSIPDQPVVTAGLIVIGNEILSGRTRDANLQFLAERLGAIGIRLREVRVVPDLEEEIVAAVNAGRQRYTYLFTTGGIGPTHDDITSAAVATAFGVALVRHPEAVRRLEAHYPPGQLNAARLRMAEIPDGATLIDNPISVAPGFRIANVFVLAGVPSIMQAMFDGLAPTLQGGLKQYACTVSCDLAEGQIAADLAALQQRYPDLEIGSYPYFRRGDFGVSLVVRGTALGQVDRAVAELCDLIAGLGGKSSVTVSNQG